MNSEKSVEELAFITLETALGVVRGSRPGDRSELDRRYAVTVTMLEQAAAYFYRYAIVMMRDEEDLGED